MHRALPSLVLAAALSLPLPTGAAAAADPMDAVQDSIGAALAAMPGGIQTAPNEITWDGGAVTLTILSPTATSPCAAGSYCAYAGLNRSGAKLTFTTCHVAVSTTSIAGGMVGSIQNNRNGGIIVAKNASGTALATINGGSVLDTAPGGITQITCMS